MHPLPLEVVFSMVPTQLINLKIILSTLLNYTSLLKFVERAHLTRTWFFKGRNEPGHGNWGSDLSSVEGLTDWIWCQMLLYGWFELLCWCKSEGKSSDGAPWWPLLQKETCGAWKCLVGSFIYPHFILVAFWGSEFQGAFQCSWGTPDSWSILD